MASRDGAHRAARVTCAPGIGRALPLLLLTSCQAVFGLDDYERGGTGAGGMTGSTGSGGSGGATSASVGAGGGDIDSFAATDDTYLDQLLNENNFGQRAELKVSNSNRAVLRFNLAETVPKGTEVFAATLTLHVESGSLSSPPELYRISEFNVPWIEGAGNGTVAGATGESCWKDREILEHGWAGSAGLGTEWSDYIPEITPIILQTSDVIQWDVTDAVIFWVDQPMKNAGLLVRTANGATGEVIFVSDEGGAGKPELLVRHE